MAGVLIVEDEDLLRSSLASYLESRGRSVATARCIADAHRQLGGRHFDVVVLDLGLPDGDGLSLLPRLGGARPLVISAHLDASRLRRHGVNCHLAKPLDLALLWRAVEGLDAARTHRHEHCSPAP